MKVLLSMKAVLCYLLIGIFGFFLVTLGGSYFVEKYFERDIGTSLYKEADSIASYDNVKNILSEAEADTENTRKEMQTQLSALSAFQDTVISIINEKGEVILSSDEISDLDFPLLLDGFDSAEWNKKHYQTGDFYGFFPDDKLSIIAPVTCDSAVKGYVSIHYKMENIYETRSGILPIIQVIFLIISVFTFLLMLAYRGHIYLPLQEITKGATEYANGNLSYKIPVDSDN